MDTFQYVCRSSGVVAVIRRDQILDAKPPTACPYCGRELRVEVVRDNEAACRGSAT
jgi:hypothetical protein